MPLFDKLIIHKKLLGKVLAAKHLMKINGEVKIPKIAVSIQSTVGRAHADYLKEEA